MSTILFICVGGLIGIWASIRDVKTLDMLLLFLVGQILGMLILLPYLQ